MNYSYDLFDVIWWKISVFILLKENHIYSHSELKELSIKDILIEWWCFKEKQELENAIQWFDSQLSEIERKFTGTDTKEIGGKSYTLKKENTAFFINREYEKVFGENPFIKEKIVLPALGSKAFSDKDKWVKNNIQSV